MPQMYPLDWVIMMPISILVLKIFLIMIYYLNYKLFFKLKVKDLGGKMSHWEW
uniref:ATP synthase F0 subunit 8 n=1 Tax=Epiperipatus biolleyi TaxID=172520 RepID=A3QU24_EPIBI|nr:ATP synthase F0 subunit 8 [Epiperipatus biolleyi]ABF93295.1 ATP synthase F0 subunit 8 [Epiperipatus biolleyi]